MRVHSKQSSQNRLKPPLQPAWLVGDPSAAVKVFPLPSNQLPAPAPQSSLATEHLSKLSAAITARDNHAASWMQTPPNTLNVKKYNQWSWSYNLYEPRWSTLSGKQSSEFLNGLQWLRVKKAWVKTKEVLLNFTKQEDYSTAPHARGESSPGPEFTYFLYWQNPPMVVVHTHPQHSLPLLQGAYQNEIIQRENKGPNWSLVLLESSWVRLGNNSGSSKFKTLHRAGKNLKREKQIKGLKRRIYV